MSSTPWPPGLLYVVQIIPKLALPLLPVLIAHRISSYILPTYLWTIAYILAAPAMIVVLVVSQRLREEGEIKKLGARRVPEVLTRWPGGLDGSLKVVKGFTNGYLRASLCFCLRNDL
jgi:hypothetical protein